jgi:hypothetical protein
MWVLGEDVDRHRGMAVGEMLVIMRHMVLVVHIHRMRCGVEKVGMDEGVRVHHLEYFEFDAVRCASVWREQTEWRGCVKQREGSTLPGDGKWK